MLGGEPKHLHLMERKPAPRLDSIKRVKGGLNRESAKQLILGQEVFVHGFIEFWYHDDSTERFGSPTTLDQPVLRTVVGLRWRNEGVREPGSKGGWRGDIGWEPPEGPSFTLTGRVLVVETKLSLTDAAMESVPEQVSLSLHPSEEE